MRRIAERPPAESAPAARPTAVRPSTMRSPAILDLLEQPMPGMAHLREVDPPPNLVARVMTRLSEPPLPSLWQWLRRPFCIEIRLSPLALIGLALLLTAAFVFVGATLR